MSDEDLTPLEIVEAIWTHYVKPHTSDWREMEAAIKSIRADLAQARRIPEPSQGASGNSATARSDKTEAEGGVSRTEPALTDLQDAKRYRWLRDHAFWEDERDFAPGGRWWVACLVREGRPSMDEAIDRALTATKSHPSGDQGL